MDEYDWCSDSDCEIDDCPTCCSTAFEIAEDLLEEGEESDESSSDEEDEEVADEPEEELDILEEDAEE